MRLSATTALDALSGSLDDVARILAALDKVFGMTPNPENDDDNRPLMERINRQHGTYITEYAEKIGLGSKSYNLVTLK
jgi:uncharacterized Fe-S center protein